MYSCAGGRNQKSGLIYWVMRWGHSLHENERKCIRAGREHKEMGGGWEKATSLGLQLYSYKVKWIYTAG